MVYMYDNHSFNGRQLTPETVQVDHKLRHDADTLQDDQNADGDQHAATVQHLEQTTTYTETQNSMVHEMVVQNTITMDRLPLPLIVHKNHYAL